MNIKNCSLVDLIAAKKIAMGNVRQYEPYQVVVDKIGTVKSELNNPTEYKKWQNIFNKIETEITNRLELIEKL